MTEDHTQASDLESYRAIAAQVEKGYRTHTIESMKFSAAMTALAPAAAIGGATALGLPVSVPVAVASVGIAAVMGVKGYLKDRDRLREERDEELKWWSKTIYADVSEDAAFDEKFKLPLPLKERLFNAYSDLAGKINERYQNLFTKGQSFVQETIADADRREAVFQSKYPTPDVPMGKGWSSESSRQAIEKMAAALADMRDACGKAEKNGSILSQFGARKLRESTDEIIKDAVVHLRQDGNHKAIFDKIGTQLDALTGYGKGIMEKGGLSQEDSAQRILIVAQTAQELGANPETMRHATEKAERTLQQADHGSSMSMG